MYIIKTFKQDVRIDSDELKKLTEHANSKLIFFRQGAVNPAHIVAVVLDEERRSEVLRLVNETDEQHQQRIDSEKSVDIFESVRKNTQSADALSMPPANLIGQ